MTLIAAIGIPGSGKSSLVRGLEDSYKLTAFYEPEERDWPIAVSNRETSGLFTCITWFRSVRVPQLYLAQGISNDNGFAAVDSYFDKLIYHYMGKPGLDWLMPKSDPYYDIMKDMAQKDYESLPNADAVVGLRVDQDVWQRFIENRGRNLDKNEKFKEDCFHLQEFMLKAAKTYASENNKVYIEHLQDGGGIAQTVSGIVAKLQEQGISLAKKESTRPTLAAHTINKLNKFEP